MITLAITGKADKRILVYPLLHACSLAGKVSVVTDDVAFKRLYEGKAFHGETEQISVHIYPGMNEDDVNEAKKLASEEDTDYLIFVSDSYCPDDTAQTLLLCEHNKTFFGETIEDINFEHNDYAFGMITIAPNKDLRNVPKDVSFRQLAWRPEYSVYLMKSEEMHVVMPIKDKFIISFLTDVFAKPLDISPNDFAYLIKREKYQLKKKK